MNAERQVTTLADERSDVVLRTDAATLMEVISRAAADPATDVDKLERLMGLYERIGDRQAVQAFNEAMSAAQAALRPVATDAANPQTRSRYASYGALDRAVRPIYTRHGFALSFNTGDSPLIEHLRVICKVSHSAGHSEPYHVDMPADGKGAKGGDVMTKTHATGAAMSYGQRYLLKLIFNIAVGDDLDGNAPPGEPITVPQLDDLVALMDEVGADRQRFLNYFKTPSLAELPASKYAAAVASLEKKRQQP
jgi:hypothetical protein